MQPRLIFMTLAWRAMGRSWCGRSSLCAQHAGFNERAVQKSFSCPQLLDLGVKHLQTHHGGSPCDEFHGPAPARLVNTISRKAAEQGGDRRESRFEHLAG